MASPDLPFYIGFCLCIAIMVTNITAYAALLPKDNRQNSILLIIVTVFSFIASAIGYGLALFYFTHNPANLIQFLLAITMLVILPSSLIAVSISTITISNLRDTLAAGAQ